MDRRLLKGSSRTRTLQHQESRIEDALDGIVPSPLRSPPHSAFGFDLRRQKAGAWTLSLVQRFRNHTGRPVRRPLRHTYCDKKGGSRVLSLSWSAAERQTRPPRPKATSTLEATDEARSSLRRRARRSTTSLIQVVL